jgi:PDDEXK-like domain of unknown function (DUF3799)
MTTPVALSAGLHADVPMEFYHGHCCPGPSVSGSILYTLHSSCPAKALASHYLSPWGNTREESSPAMEFGSAAHCYICEGKAVFAERYAIKPADYDGRTKAGKDWLAANAGKPVIAFRDFEKITGMAIGVASNPHAHAAFTEGAPEMTGIWQDAETGIWLKVRPDYLRKGLAINYKTARDAATEPWKRQAWNLGYHVSAALCVDVLKALGEPALYAFVTQEKDAPYLCGVRVLADDFLEGGRMIYRRALRTFADCVAADKWPGFSDGVETIVLPPWGDRTLANMESPL